MVGALNQLMKLQQGAGRTLQGSAMLEMLAGDSSFGDLLGEMCMGKSSPQQNLSGLGIESVNTEGQLLTTFIGGKESVVIPHKLLHAPEVTDINKETIDSLKNVDSPMNSQFDESKSLISNSQTLNAADMTFLCDIDCIPEEFSTALPMVVQELAKAGQAPILQDAPQLIPLTAQIAESKEVQQLNLTEKVEAVLTEEPFLESAEINDANFENDETFLIRPKILPAVEQNTDNNKLENAAATKVEVEKKVDVLETGKSLNAEIVQGSLKLEDNNSLNINEIEKLGGQLNNSNNILLQNSNIMLPNHDLQQSNILGQGEVTKLDNISAADNVVVKTVAVNDNIEVAMLEKPPAMVQNNVDIQSHLESANVMMNDAIVQQSSNIDNIGVQKQSEDKKLDAGNKVVLDIGNKPEEVKISVSTNNQDNNHNFSQSKGGAEIATVASEKENASSSENNDTFAQTFENKVNGNKNNSQITHANQKMASLADSVNQQVSMKVIGAVKSKLGTVDVQLFPKDLGKVHISMEMNGNETKLHITAEKFTTLDMLQKNAHNLESILQENGLKSENTNLSFQFKGHDKGQQNKENNESQHEELKGNIFNEDEDGFNQATLGVLDPDKVDIVT